MKYKLFIIALSIISAGSITLTSDQEAFIAALLLPAHTDELAALLRENPSLANAHLAIKDIITTPLRIAAVQEEHRCELVSLLLEHKADCNALLTSPREMHRNRTLLMDIADAPDIVFDRHAQEIFKRCLREPIDFNLKDIDGATLLELLTCSVHNPLLDEPYKSRAQKLLLATEAKKKEQDFFYSEWFKQAQSKLIVCCKIDEIYIAAIMAQYAKPSIYELHKLMDTKRT